MNNTLYSQELSSLPPRSRNKELLVNIIAVCVVSIACWVGWMFTAHLFFNVLIGFVQLLLVFFVYIDYKAFSFKKYRVRESDVLYQKGFLFRKITLIPFNRIQHIEMTQGPIERQYNLATLVFFTAGGMSSDMEIGNLDADEAIRVREELIAKVGSIREE